MPTVYLEDFVEKAEITVSWPYKTVDNLISLDSLLSVLKSAPVIAFDTEYDAADGTPVGFSFCCDSTMSYYVPFGHTTGERQLDHITVLDSFGPIFADKNKLWTMHNGKAEFHTLHRLGIKMEGQIWDTMIATFMLDGIDTFTAKGQVPQRRISLKERAYEDLGGLTWCTFNDLVRHNHVLSHKEITQGKTKGRVRVSYESRKWRTGEVPIQRMAPYATADAYATYGLFHKYKEKMNQETFKSIKRAFEDFEMPFVRVLHDMEIEGISLDLKYLHEYRERMRKKRQEIQMELYRVAGGINLSSPKQLRELLFDTYKFVPRKVSPKTGTPSTDSETLKQLIEENPDHPFLKPFGVFRDLNKQIGTYLDAYLGVSPEDAAKWGDKPRDSIVRPDGKVSCDFRQTGTRTGRLAAGEPNLQNITRQKFIKDEQGNKVPADGLRRAFIADPGKLLIGSDYSQLELRILAHVSQDPFFLEAYRKGIDLHKFCASIMFNVKLEDVSDFQRQAAKTIGFGILYGMGKPKLAASLGIGLKEADELYRRYFDNFTGVAGAMNGIVAQCRKYGFVKTLLGRRRYLPDIIHFEPGLKKRAERQAFNTVIQGTGADIVKAAQIKISRDSDLNAMGYKMQLQVHDEIIGQVAEKYAKDACDRVQHLMETVVTLLVPLVAEPKAALNWAMLK